MQAARIASAGDAATRETSRSSDLADRVAIVTGAAAGLGLAIARELAERGAAVLLADRDEKRVEAAAAELGGTGARVRAIAADVGVPGDVDAMVETAIRDLGRLDILVSNAGIGDLAPFLEASLEHWERVLQVNLTGVFLCGQAAARHMARHGGGRIVNIASISGMLAGTGRAAYGTSKAAVIHLTRQMALELGPLGITVNAVAPGPIDTTMARAAHTPQTRAAYLARIPLHRYGLPEEVAAAVAYLCSDAAGYVNGQVLAVDGGFVISGVTAGDLV